MVADSTKQRLFIALYPPLDLIEQLFSEVVVVKNKARRLVDKSQAHLTLLFLGDVDTVSIANLIKQLESICDQQQAFSIETLGYRHLPSNKNPRLLALSCRLSSELARLHNECKSVLINQSKNKKPFLPHITVCRYKRKPNNLIIPDHQPTRFKVSQLKLMHSQLLPDRAVHQCLEHFKLNQ